MSSSSSSLSSYPPLPPSDRTTLKGACEWFERSFLKQLKTLDDDATVFSFDLRVMQGLTHAIAQEETYMQSRHMSYTLMLIKDMLQLFGGITPPIQTVVMTPLEYFTPDLHEYMSNLLKPVDGLPLGDPRSPAMFINSLPHTQFLMAVLSNILLSPVEMIYENGVSVPTFQPDAAHGKRILDDGVPGLGATLLPIIVDRIRQADGKKYTRRRMLRNASRFFGPVRMVLAMPLEQRYDLVMDITHGEGYAVFMQSVSNADGDYGRLVRLVIDGELGGTPKQIVSSMMNAKSGRKKGSKTPQQTLDALSENWTTDLLYWSLEKDARSGPPYVQSPMTEALLQGLPLGPYAPQVTERALMFRHEHVLDMLQDYYGLNLVGTRIRTGRESPFLFLSAKTNHLHGDDISASDLVSRLFASPSSSAKRS